MKSEAIETSPTKKAEYAPPALERLEIAETVKFFGGSGGDTLGGAENP